MCAVNQFHSDLLNIGHEGTDRSRQPAGKKHWQRATSVNHVHEQWPSLLLSTIECWVLWLLSGAQVSFTVVVQSRPVCISYSAWIGTWSGKEHSCIGQNRGSGKPTSYLHSMFTN